MAKKLLAMILAIVMIVTLLAACGGSGNSSTGGGNQSQAGGGNSSVADKEDSKTDDVSTPADSDEEPYNVVMEYMYYGELSPDFEEIEQAISERAKELINCTVTFVPVGLFDADTTMNMMLSGGEQLDLMIAMGGTGFQNAVNRNQVIELDDLYAQYGKGIEETMGLAVMGGYLNGKLYAIPSLDKFGREYGLIGNVEYMDKYELATRNHPTYEQLDEWFARVKEGEGEAFYPFILSGSTSTTYNYFHSYDALGSADASGVILQEHIDDPTIVDLFETEEYKEHLKWMHKWYEEGYINPDALTTSETTQSHIQNNKGAVYTIFVEMDMLPQQQGQFDTYGQTVDRILLVDKFTTQGNLNSQNWMVTVNSENPEKAFQFLNLLYEDDEIINLLYWGIEGKHYVKTDKNMTVAYPDGVDGTNVGYQQPLGLYGAVAKRYIMGNAYPDDYFEQLAEFDDIHEGDPDVSPYLGYSFNTEPYKTEFAAVNDVISQYRYSLEVGAVDPEEVLPQFIDALKAAGIDTIIEANQQSLNEWLASK